MKILFFVDSHGYDDVMRKLKEKSRHVDMIVCAGDYTIFESDIDNILREFNSWGKPFLLIHGNHETAAATLQHSAGLDNIIFVHKNIYIKDNVAFFGYGGGGFAIHDPKFDKAADEFVKTLEAVKKKDKKDYKTILILHAPPYGTKLDDLGDHVGCMNFTKFIEKHQPMIAVAGHIHENSGKEDKIGSTLIMNPSPLGKIVEIK